jgi:hypothetical protein
MKILTFYSDSHLDMYNNYFLSSYKKYLSGHKLISKKIDQMSPTGEYESPGFDYTMLEKIRLIIENIDTSDDSLLVYSDCDVQFFRELEFEMGDNDILFQNDYFPENYCAGFFAARQNEKVLKFFREVHNRLVNSMDGRIHDQTVICSLFSEGYNGIKKGMLPFNKYWTSAFSTNGKPWVGQDLVVPGEIIAHHANFTVGIKNKIFLLEKVKNIITRN